MYFCGRSEQVADSRSLSESHKGIKKELERELTLFSYDSCRPEDLSRSDDFRQSEVKLASKPKKNYRLNLPKEHHGRILPDIWRSAPDRPLGQNKSKLLPRSKKESEGGMSSFARGMLLPGQDAAFNKAMGKGKMTKRNIKKKHGSDFRSFPRLSSLKRMLPATTCLKPLRGSSTLPSVPLQDQQFAFKDALAPFVESGKAPSWARGTERDFPERDLDQSVDLDSLGTEGILDLSIRLGLRSAMSREPLW